MLLLNTTNLHWWCFPAWINKMDSKRRCAHNTHKEKNSPRSTVQKGPRSYRLNNIARSQRWDQPPVHRSPLAGRHWMQCRVAWPCDQDVFPSRTGIEPWSSIVLAVARWAFYNRAQANRVTAIWSTYTYFQCVATKIRTDSENKFPTVHSNPLRWIRRRRQTVTT